MTQPEHDEVWETIRQEVTLESQAEPMLANFFYGVVLNHRRLEDALSFLLAAKLESTTIPSIAFRELFEEAFQKDPAIVESARKDIAAVRMRDPACRGYNAALLYFKGVHALESYRVAHYFWQKERYALALYLQSRMSQVLGVDIHPAARIGSSVFIDHATSVVIGETAVVEDNVSMLHEVTLGGTGKQTGDRHPKIRRGVLIGAGAKILGNVEVGAGAKIGAGSVVLNDVPPHVTVAGVPAKVVGHTQVYAPALEMDHKIQVEEDENAP